MGGMGGYALFLVVGLLYSGMGEEGYIQGVVDSKKGLDQIAPWLYSQMTSDWLVTAFLGLSTAVVAYLFVIKKLEITFDVRYNFEE